MDCSIIMTPTFKFKGDCQCNTLTGTTSSVNDNGDNLPVSWSNPDSPGTGSATVKIGPDGSECSLTFSMGPTHCNSVSTTASRTNMSGTFCDQLEQQRPCFDTCWTSYNYTQDTDCSITMTPTFKFKDDCECDTLTGTTSSVNDNGDILPVSWSNPESPGTGSATVSFSGDQSECSLTLSMGSTGSSQAGAIAGGVIGGLILLGLISFLAYRSDHSISCPKGKRAVHFFYMDN